MMQFLIAAPRSGSGKTTVTCAILAALKQRGANPCAFKSGPDYIDPMFHRSVLGVESHNLDLFLSEKPVVQSLYAHYAAGHGAAVCEGAMGFYDGQGLTPRASAWELADTLDLPVLLVVQPKGASVTLAAEIQGLVHFRPESHIAGILLNDCSEKLYNMLSPLLETETGLPVLGYLPHLPQAAVESRHLGLKTAGEIAGLQQKIGLLADSLVLDWAKLAELTDRPEPAAAQLFSAEEKQAVRIAVAENLALRRTSVCRMAQAAHCEVLPVDMGMAGEPVPGVRDCRIAAGTADFTLGPAMRREQAVEAIGKGIALARELAADGCRLIATGEMGIGNTTTSSAVASVLLGQPVERMTGRGAGLSDEGLARKVDAICRGILRNEPDPEDVLDVLAKLGGFDIAGLCGLFLGGALAGVPVLMDGFISGVAALCAVRLCPAAAKAVFASHCSAEPAARLVLEALGKAPLITAGLHLGEGTGAVASIPLWDMALAVYGGCYSFAEGGIAPYTPQC